MTASRPTIAAALARTYAPIRQAATGALLADPKRSDMVISDALGGRPSPMTVWRIRRQLESDCRVHCYSRHLHSSRCWCWLPATTGGDGKGKRIRRYPARPCLESSLSAFCALPSAIQADYEHQAAALLASAEQRDVLAAAACLWAGLPQQRLRDHRPPRVPGTDPTIGHNAA